MKGHLAVGVSGAGTLLDAMIGDELPVTFVFADRECRGLKIAEAYGIRTLILPRSFKKSLFDLSARREYTCTLVDELRKRNIGLVAMAGFQTILTEEFFEAFGGRVTNIHPSLLPEFKGHYAVRDALRAGVTETGSTVHFMTLELDDGPIIEQVRVPVLPGDTEETLHERIKVQERRLYPRVIRRLMAEID